MRVRRDHGEFGEQTDGGRFDLLGIVNAERVFVVGRESGDGARQNGHRMRAVRERVEESAEVFVQEGVPADALVECGELVDARQITVDEEIGHLEIGRAFGNILDRVSAVPQDALVAIDVGDRTLGRRGVHEPLVEGGESGLLGEGRDVDTRHTLGTPQNRKFRHTSGVVECGLIRMRRLGVVPGSVVHGYSLIGPGGYRWNRQFFGFSVGGLH